MKLQEAYNLLGVKSDAPPDEIKKQFRKLAKQYHPDNQDTGDEAKFKEINQAYKIASSGEGDEHESSHPNMQDILNGFSFFNQRQNVHAAPVKLTTTISFNESVLGCKRDLSYVRKGKCVTCSGQGQINQNNGCTKCNGRGVMTSQRGNMIFTQKCDKCAGPSRPINCSACNGDGTIDNNISVNVNIPGAVNNTSVLKLSGMGNFHSSIMGMDQYMDAHLHINVKSGSELVLEPPYVLSVLKISLLEALQGCTKSVNTVLGFKEIKVEPLSKNKEEIIIPRVGINGTGDQKVILDISYPKDINKLIGVLTEN